MTARVQLLADYRTNQDAARTLIGGMTGAQLNWRGLEPWSVADCLDHMARTNTAFGKAISTAIEDPAAARTNSRFARWIESRMVRMIEPPVRLRFQAPPQLHPTRPEWGREILDVYVESHQVLLAALRDSCDIEEIRFRHPVRRFHMTILGGLRAMAAHDRRHLWQASMIGLNWEKPAPPESLSTR